MFLLRAKQIPMVVNLQDRKFSKEPVKGNALKLIDLS
jgi:hypothetical protein